MLPTYDLHLDPSTLSAGRKFIARLSPGFADTGCARGLKKIDALLADAAEHFGNFKRAFDDGGLPGAAGNVQRQLATTYLTLAVELIDCMEYDHEVDGAVGKDVYGDAREIFDKKVEAVLERLADNVGTLLRNNYKKSEPAYRSGRFGDALAGRLENLTTALHLCAVVLRFCEPEGERDYHPQRHRFLALSARVHRNYAEALILRAKELEASKKSR